MRLIGLDPGLQRTGWGVVEAQGTRLRWIASGTLKSDGSGSLAERLAELYRDLQADDFESKLALVHSR